MRSTLTINPNEEIGSLDDLYGVFFEDINHAADGGLYAELVQNRSFEFDGIDNSLYHPLTAWEIVRRRESEGEVYVSKLAPLHPNHPNYAVIQCTKAGEGIGLKNQGFNTGMNIGEELYYFSCYARTAKDVTLHITLESDAEEVLAEDSVKIKRGGWDYYAVTILPHQASRNGKLTVTLMEEGKVCLDIISLFPVHTFKDRRNGMRRDLAKMIADMHPKFMRFPGGCLVHDGSLNPEDRNSMYRWKNTVGPVWQRPSRRNNWGYNQTLGLGYYEYFQFCEDIGAKPLPVLPGAYDPHHKRIEPLSMLQPWIDDALDLIEFANGSADTEWGAVRAQMGHPEPFGLEYIAIGNEEVGEAFFERYGYFHQAIKAKYPDIKIINSASPFAEGKEYERGWESARKWKSDLIDEHYYEAPDWMIANYHRYDKFSPEGPKVFLGEYASLGNTWYNALAEAAYMTGLEKNARVVKLACYAPMLCNKDYVNWTPDMIWFDGYRVHGSASYYVQKMFMRNQGATEVAVQGEGLPAVINAIEDLSGKITFKSDGKMVLENIVLENLDTGETKSFEDITLNSKKKKAVLTQTEWANYRLSFKGTERKGTKGMVLYFAEKNPKKYLNWTIGGWQNQDSTLASSAPNGKESCLTQSLFELEPKRTYKFTMEVRGRMLRTLINGKECNQVEYKPALVEPLYYCASKETDGTVIVKVVNLQKESVRADIRILGETHLHGTVESISGNKREDMNTFYQPKLIFPKTSGVFGKTDTVSYEFPADSVSVFRFIK